MSIYFSSRALNYSSFCVSVSCLLFLWHPARKERNLAAKNLPLTLNRKIWEGEVDRASQDITRPTWPCCSVAQGWLRWWRWRFGVLWIPLCSRRHRTGSWKKIGIDHKLIIRAPPRKYFEPLIGVRILQRRLFATWEHDKGQESSSHSCDRRPTQGRKVHDIKMWKT